MTRRFLLAATLVLGAPGLAVFSAAQERVGSPDWRSPCLTPIKYRIDALDPRFGITREDFRRSVERAGDLWGAVAGRKLFSYDESGPLVIDLVYDGRQEATQRLTAARAGISEKLKGGDEIEAQLRPLRDRFRTLDDSFSGQLSSYEHALEAHNQAVTHWNRQGGAPQGEQARLVSEAATLQEKGSVLKNKRLELNRLVDEINVRVVKHNALLDRANAEANLLNNSGSLGVEFEEGHYTRQGDAERIQIFEYDGETALVIILAHEMGHALGIRHNANPASIMSPLVHTRELALTADDKDGLRVACSPR